MSELTQEFIVELAEELRKAEAPNDGVSATPAQSADDFLFYPNSNPHPQNAVGSGSGLPSAGMTDSCVLCDGVGESCKCLDGLNKSDKMDKAEEDIKWQNPIIPRHPDTRKPVGHLMTLGFAPHGNVYKIVHNPDKKHYLSHHPSRANEDRTDLGAHSSAEEAKEAAKNHASNKTNKSEVETKMKKSESPLMKRKMQKDMADQPAMGDSQGNMYMSEKGEPAPMSKEKIYGDKYRKEKQAADDKRIHEAHSKEVDDVRNGRSGKPWLNGSLIGKTELEKNALSGYGPGAPSSPAPKSGTTMGMGKSEKGSTYEMCPDCEASFKLPKGSSLPEHNFCGKRCEMSGKSLTVDKKKSVKKGEDLIDMAHEGDKKKRLKEFAGPHEGVVPDDKDAKKMPKYDKGNEGPVIKLGKEEMEKAYISPYVKYGPSKPKPQAPKPEEVKKAEWKSNGDRPSESHKENTHEMHVEEHPSNKSWRASYLNEWGHKKSSEGHKSKEEARSAAEKAKMDFIRHHLTTSKSELHFNKMSPTLYRAEMPVCKYEVKKTSDGHDLYRNEEHVGKYTHPEVAMEKACEMHKAEMGAKPPSAKPPPAPKMATPKAPPAPGAAVGTGMGMKKTESPLMKRKGLKKTSLGGSKQAFQHAGIAGSKEAAMAPAVSEPKAKMPSMQEHQSRSNSFADFMPPVGKK